MRMLTVIKRSPFVFPLACMVAAAMVFISEGSYRRSVDSLDKLGTLETVRACIQELSQSILDAETGQRGYLLTYRKEYLLPYDKAIKNIEESFQSLDLYYTGKAPKSIQILKTLHTLTEAKVSELAMAIRLHDEGKGDAVTELVLSDIGKQKMEAIRSLGAELLAYETSNVAQGRIDIYRTLVLSRIGVAALSIISLLALYFVRRQTAMLTQSQLELKRTALVDRDRLEVEIAQRTAQLTELAQHLQTAREDERGRLARDLHDELGALLTSAKLDVARIKSRLAGTAPEALERLNHLITTLNSGIALKRRIIEDLRPSSLVNLGLVTTLEILAREFAERSGLVVQRALTPVTLGDTAELVVYRVVQEAITNITKYARARQVWVTLAQHGNRVEVTVRDDGVGFDTTVKPNSAYGLVGMRFRVAAERGTLTVESALGQGTTIRVTLPTAAQ